MGVKTVGCACCMYITLALLTSILYFTDIGLDIKLAVRYFESGDVNWASCTTAFIAIPWFFMGFGAAILLVAGAVNLTKGFNIFPRLFAAVLAIAIGLCFGVFAPVLLLFRGMV